MAFNQGVINTNIPPPNFPAVSMQFPAHQMNQGPTPPNPQHVFNQHMSFANPPPTHLSAPTSNNLPTSIPSSGFIHNPLQSPPPPMWNNSNSIPMVNKNHIFSSSAPLQYAHNNPTINSFQVPPPIPVQQFQPSSWNNSNNHLRTNNNSLLAIAPTTPSVNHQINNPPPAGFDFQFTTDQFNGNQTGNNVSFWSNNNSFKNEPLPLNDYKNNFNLNGDSNKFSNGNNWNPIQKTNVPDSNIFQNPCAIFNVTGNNHNSCLSDSNNFQSYNATNPSFPITRRDFIPLNQGDKFNSPSNNNSVFENKNNNLSHNRYFHKAEDFKINHIQKFQQTKIEANSTQRKNFMSINGQNLMSFQQGNQNLIDVHVTANKDSINGKVSNHKFFPANNYRRSVTSSTVIEEYTISDSESIESINSKGSPQKNLRNKRNPTENLQSIKSDTFENIFQPKTGWMTDDIKKALQKRNMLFKQARTTNDPAVWEEYNKLKNEINEEIKQAKLTAKNIYPRPKRNTPKVMQDSRGKNFPFNCDTCDRGFSSINELEVHFGLHIKCDYSGCHFEAHPKIVSLHQKMQHDTGYAEVINKLQNDEEIKKWREERRRRFPTAENILKKKAEKAEKEARGEVIEERHYGQFNKRKFQQEDRSKGNFQNKRRRNCRRRRNGNFFQRAPEINLAEDSDSEDEKESPTKLPKFRGIKEDYEGLVVNDDIKIEYASLVKIEEAENNASTENSKVSSNQQDIKDIDDEDDAPLEIPIQKVSLHESSDSDVEICNKPLVKENKTELLDETSVENSCTRSNTGEKSNNDDNSRLKDNKGNKRERQRRCPPLPPRPRRPKNSLLQMLLSDEIRHERNVIMQCVRHIVRNEFFGIGSNA